MVDSSSLRVFGKVNVNVICRSQHEDKKAESFDVNELVYNGIRW